MKRGRNDQPRRDQGLETRIVNLIVRVGDKNASQLASQLEGLAAALQGDMNFHRRLIIDTILDCARSLLTKANIYGTLVGLLNAADPAGGFGADIVRLLRRELQGVLDDHATMGIRGLTRFAIALMNAKVVSEDDAMELLERLAGTTAEENAPTARADWFCAVVMDALVLGGKALSASVPERLDRLVGALKGHAARRRPLAEAASLLAPYGASTGPDDLVEHYDALLSLVVAMSDDGGWSSPYLLAPHRAFPEELARGQRHSLDAAAMSVPPHSPGCTYPSLHRLRLLQPADAAPAANDGGGDAPMADAPTEGGGGGGGRVRGPMEDAERLPAAERTLVEEGVFMLVTAFAASHKDCAKLLVGMAEELELECSAVFVEVLLSLLLALPAPKHQLMYYSIVLMDVCKLVPRVPLALERAVNGLFARLPRLDVHLAERLADWLAFHVSNFGFSLAPFGRPWGEVLPPDAGGGEEEKAGGGAVTMDPSERFVRCLLDRMVRLSYPDRVARELPQPFLRLMPLAPSGALEWGSAPKEGDLKPLSEVGLSAALLGKLRNKLPPPEVTGWVDSELGAHPLRMALVAQTLFHAGNKSVSHLEKLLEKYGWLLAHVAPTPPAKTELVRVACAYWRAAPQMRALLCRKLIEHRLVDPAAVLAHALSPAGAEALACAEGWEAVNEAVDSAVRKQRDLAADLAKAERRVHGMRRDGAPPADVGRAEDRAADVKAAHEEARREKKAAFASLFAGACAVLGGDADGGAPAELLGRMGAADRAEWRRVCLGRIHAVGRLYRGDFSLETVETVAEGSDVPEAVRDEVFAPLRQLEQHCG